jgi:hypothetical protein
VVKVAPALRHTAAQVGGMIKQARGPMSLAELAERSGFSKSTLARWEKGTEETPTPEQALRLDKLLALDGHLHRASAQAISHSAFGVPRKMGYVVFPEGHIGDVYVLLQAPPGQHYRTVKLFVEFNDEPIYNTQVHDVDEIGRALFTAKRATLRTIVLLRTSHPVLLTYAPGYPDLPDDRVHLVRHTDFQRQHPLAQD